MYFETSQLKVLTLARYEFRVRADDDVVLPPFLGSTLRGAFGHALKAISCSMPHGDCGRCFLVERCLYPRFFETTGSHAQKQTTDTRMEPALTIRSAANSRTPGIDSRNINVSPAASLLSGRQDAPRPYIFVPPLVDTDARPARDSLLRMRVPVRAGEPVVFGLTLFGRAIHELPYFIYAASLMARHGFGAERTPFHLESVNALDQSGRREHVYSSENPFVLPHSNCITTLEDLTRARVEALVDKVSEDRSVTLRFLTPARLRVKGRVIERLDFERLISSLSLRLSLLSETHGDNPYQGDYKALLECARRATTLHDSLSMVLLERVSNRQRTRIEMDGFIGDVTYSGDAVPQLLPLIAAGEFLHIGSGSAFGLGRYFIEGGGQR